MATFIAMYTPLSPSFNALFRKVAPGLFLCMLSILACKQEEHKDNNTPDAPIQASIKLQSLPSLETGMTFVNKINDEGRVNIFTWHFIYNGAGVAVGDINNDGLTDIYFTGNQVPDRLYLNKGNFKFEDITDHAGIGKQV